MRHRRLVRLAAGAVLGWSNFITFWLAFVYLMRRGLFSPTPWYDWAVAAALIFGPCLAWHAYLFRKAVRRSRSGTVDGRSIRHGFACLAAFPAGVLLAQYVAALM